MDASELLKRYAAGERDFLFCVDLSRAYLKGAYLNGANLNSADLSGANLNGANLDTTDMTGVDLTLALLNGATLVRATLEGANMNGANLSRADLSYADLGYANLLKANLSEANLYRAYLSEVNLTLANLKGAVLVETNLSRADLSGADLSGADLNRVDLTDANLTNANLAEANLTNATLKRTKIDGTILANQKTSEQVQQENQELIERIKLLEAQLAQQKSVQNLIQANNQGTNALYQWNGFYFRSQTEIKIAESLDRTGVLYYPNSKARLNKAEVRINRESDFLVFQAGKFGILEVDGRPYHQTAADDHERDRLFKRYGIRVIERFDATRCWNDPDKVVQEFLEILSQA